MSHEEALDRLLSQFVDATAGTRYALVVGEDGLRRARSAHLDVEMADQLSAASCSLVTLAGGAAGLVGLGAVRQTIIELDDGHLFLIRIPGGATLAVVAESDCDMARVGYEMTLLGARAVDVLRGSSTPWSVG